MAPPVVVTRPRGPQGGLEAFIARLSESPVTPVVFSPQTIKFLSLLPNEEQTVLDVLSSRAPAIAFLSPTAVFACKDLLHRLGRGQLDASTLLASQGPGTSDAIEACFGRRPFFESSVSTAEVFAEEFLKLAPLVSGLLVPQSAIGRDVFAPLLKAGGVSVCEFAGYTLMTVTPGEDEQCAISASAAKGGYIIFMSPSAVRATLETCRDQEGLRRLKVISIGPTTSDAVRETGLSLHVEATDHSEEGVLSALNRCVDASSF
jgi:uroporphyrinogen-III synthase